MIVPLYLGFCFPPRDHESQLFNGMSCKIAHRLLIDQYDTEPLLKYELPRVRVRGSV